MEKDTWKDIFCRQVDDGEFWKNLFKDEFDRHQFLDRSDAVYICEKAQSDIYEIIIKKLEGRVSEEIINELKCDLEKHWTDAPDNSALGMYFNGKQIK